MLRIEYLNQNIDTFKSTYHSASPFPHLVIDGACDEAMLREAVKEIPDPRLSGESQSNDFIFAKNKFETPDFEKVSPEFKALREDFLSDEFSKFLSDVTGDKIFVDPKFHGGGLHQGGAGSFLTMHADFDFHPENLKWFRNVNILLYLNDEWAPEYKGSLRLKNGDDKNSGYHEVAPLFNRLVIMQTRGNTLHGYEKISFPEKMYRRSVAAYGYTLMAKEGRGRTTVWHTESANPVTRFLGRQMPHLVKLKHKILGSNTGKARK